MSILIDWTSPVLANRIHAGETWACAVQMMEMHGEDARVRAAMNADLLLKQGDLDGYRAWLGIVRRIAALAGAEPGRAIH